MKQRYLKFIILFSIALFCSCNQEFMATEPFNSENMMIRIAVLEIEEEYLDEYLAILKEESEASIRLEPGVICIYPMFEKERPTEIRECAEGMERVAFVRRAFDRRIDEPQIEEGVVSH